MTDVLTAIASGYRGAPVLVRDDELAAISRSLSSTCLRLARREWVQDVCRVCGCTDDDACVDLDDLPCFWVAVDLCSACADIGEALDA